MVSMKSSQACHKLIKKTAQDFAGCFYEEEARLDNNFFKRFPKQKEFIAMTWNLFIPAARETLAKMLALPYSDVIKEEIHEALQLDRTLPENQIRMH